MNYLRKKYHTGKNTPPQVYKLRQSQNSKWKNLLLSIWFGNIDSDNTQIAEYWIQ